MDHLCSYPLRVSIWWYGHNNFFMMAVSNTDTFFQVISKRENFVKTFRSTFATSSLWSHCAGCRTEFAVLSNFHGCGLPQGPSVYSNVLFLCWLTCFHSIPWIAFKYPRLIGSVLFVSFLCSLSCHWRRIHFAISVCRVAEGTHNSALNCWGQHSQNQAQGLGA